MKGKHTPGPWRIARTSDGREVIAEDAGQILTIAYAQAYLQRADPTAEAQANARLIAAAPEMLATLKVALAHVTAEETTTASAATRDAMRGVAKILRAAIAIVEE